VNPETQTIRGYFVESSKKCAKCGRVMKFTGSLFGYPIYSHDCPEETPIGEIILAPWPEFPEIEEEE